MAVSRSLCLIACYDRNRGIGMNGRLAWHCPEDLARFKLLTMGHILIMGRKTYESLTVPLNGRQLIVLTRAKEYRAPECTVAHSFEEGLRYAYEDDSCPFVAGGSSIYARALPFVTRMYLTELRDAYPADAFFPAFEEQEWKEEERETENKLVFRVLARKK